MPRVTKDAEDDSEPKNARRIRKIISSSVPNSPLRRSSRFKRAESSSPESVNELAAPPVGKTTRSRAIHVEPATESSSRRSVNTVSSVNSPKMTTRASKRTGRAVSESKTPPTAVRTTRRTRASSVDPETSSDIGKRRGILSSQPTSTPPRTRRRASILPSEPSVVEEGEEKRRSVRSIPQIPEEMGVDVSPDGKSSIVSSKSPSPTSVESSRIEVEKEETKEPEEEMEVDETKESFIADKSPIDNSLKEENKLNETEPTKNITINTQMKDTDDSACKESPKSKRSSLGRSKELGLKIEDLLNKSAEDLQKSPGNKENEKLNTVPDRCKENLDFAVPNVTLLSRKSLSSAVLLRRSSRMKPNSSLDEQNLLDHMVEQRISLETPLVTGESKKPASAGDSVSEIHDNHSNDMDSDEAIIDDRGREKQADDILRTDAKSRLSGSKHVYVRLEKTVVDDMNIYEEVAVSDCDIEAKMPNNKLCLKNSEGNNESGPDGTDIELGVNNDNGERLGLIGTVSVDDNSGNKICVDEEQQENEGSTRNVLKNTDKIGIVGTKDISGNKIGSSNDQATDVGVEKISDETETVDADRSGDDYGHEENERKEQEKKDALKRGATLDERMEEVTDEPENFIARRSNENSENQIDEGKDEQLNDGLTKSSLTIVGVDSDSDQTHTVSVSGSNDNSGKQIHDFEEKRSSSAGCVFKNEREGEETDELEIYVKSGKVDESEDQQTSLHDTVEDKTNQTPIKRSSSRLSQKFTSPANKTRKQSVNVDDNKSSPEVEDLDLGTNKSNIDIVNQMGKEKDQGNNHSTTRSILEKGEVEQETNQTPIKRSSSRLSQKITSPANKTRKQSVNVDDNKSSPEVENLDLGTNKSNTDIVNQMGKEKDQGDNHSTTRSILENEVEQETNQTPIKRSSSRLSQKITSPANKTRKQSVNADDNKSSPEVENLDFGTKKSNTDIVNQMGEEKDQGDNHSTTRSILENDEVERETNQTSPRRSSSRLSQKMITSAKETPKQPGNNKSALEMENPDPGTNKSNTDILNQMNEEKDQGDNHSTTRSILENDEVERETNQTSPRRSSSRLSQKMITPAKETPKQPGNNKSALEMENPDPGTNKSNTDILNQMDEEKDQEDNHGTRYILKDDEVEEKTNPTSPRRSSSRLSQKMITPAKETPKQPGNNKSALEMENPDPGTNKSNTNIANQMGDEEHQVDNHGTTGSILENDHVEEKTNTTPITRLSSCHKPETPTPVNTENIESLLITRLSEETLISPTTDTKTANSSMKISHIQLSPTERESSRSKGTEDNLSIIDESKISSIVAESPAATTVREDEPDKNSPENSESSRKDDSEKQETDVDQSATIDESESDINLGTLFQDVSAEEWERKKNKRSSQSELFLRKREVVDDDHNSLHSVSTERLDIESETECDLVLVDNDASEPAKVEQDTVYDFDSDDTVILQQARNSSGNFRGKLEKRRKPSAKSLNESQNSEENSPKASGVHMGSNKTILIDDDDFEEAEVVSSDRRSLNRKSLKKSPASAKESVLISTVTTSLMHDSDEDTAKPNLPGSILKSRKSLNESQKSAEDPPKASGIHMGSNKTILLDDDDFEEAGVITSDRRSLNRKSLNKSPASAKDTVKESVLISTVTTSLMHDSDEDTAKPNLPGSILKSRKSLNESQKSAEDPPKKSGVHMGSNKTMLIDDDDFEEAEVVRSDRRSLNRKSLNKSLASTKDTGNESSPLFSTDDKDEETAEPNISSSVSKKNRRSLNKSQESAEDPPKASGVHMGSNKTILVDDIDEDVFEKAEVITSDRRSLNRKSLNKSLASAKDTGNESSALFSTDDKDEETAEPNISSFISKKNRKSLNKTEESAEDPQKKSGVHMGSNKTMLIDDDNFEEAEVITSDRRSLNRKSLNKSLASAKDTGNESSALFSTDDKDEETAEPNISSSISKKNRKSLNESQKSAEDLPKASGVRMGSKLVDDDFEKAEVITSDRRSLNRKSLNKSLASAKDTGNESSALFSTDDKDEETAEPNISSSISKKNRKSLNESQKSAEDPPKASGVHMGSNKTMLIDDNFEEAEVVSSDRRSLNRKSLNKSTASVKDTGNESSPLFSTDDNDEETAEPNISGSISKKNRRSLNKSQESAEDALEESSEEHLSNTCQELAEELNYSPYESTSEKGELTENLDSDSEEEEQEFSERNDEESDSGESDSAQMKKIKENLNQSKNLKSNSFFERNLSTIAAVDSDSAAGNFSESDDDSDDSSERIPKFLFSVTSSESDESYGNASIDEDIAREYNLDGNSDLEYSDDNVPADDCRASETEHSDSEDDGSDLADFVVEDDESEDESEEESEEEVKEVKRYRRIISGSSLDDEEKNEGDDGEEMSEDLEEQTNLGRKMSESLSIPEEVDVYTFNTPSKDAEELNVSKKQKTPNSSKKNREGSSTIAEENDVYTFNSPSKDIEELNVSKKQKTPNSSKKNREGSSTIAEQDDVYTFNSPSKGAEELNISKKQKTPNSSKKNREGSSTIAEQDDVYTFNSPSKGAEELNISKKQKTPNSSKKNREGSSTIAEEVDVYTFNTPSKDAEELNVSKKQKTPNSSKKNREGSSTIEEEVDVYTFNTPSKDAEELNISKKQKTPKSSKKNREEPVNFAEEASIFPFNTPSKGTEELNISKKQKTPKFSKKNREEPVNFTEEASIFPFNTPSKGTEELNISKKQKTPKSSKKNREGSSTIEEEASISTFDTPIKDTEQLNISKKQKTPKSSKKSHEQSIHIVEESITPKLQTPKLSELNKSMQTPNTDTPTTKFLKKERLNESLPPLSRKAKQMLRRSTLLNVVKNESLNIASKTGQETNTSKNAEDEMTSSEEDDDEEDLEKNDETNEDSSDDEGQEEEEELDEENGEDIDEEESEEEEEDDDSSDEEEAAKTKKHLPNGKKYEAKSTEILTKQQKSSRHKKAITEETDEDSNKDRSTVTTKGNQSKKKSTASKHAAEERELDTKTKKNLRGSKQPIKSIESKRPAEEADAKEKKRTKSARNKRHREDPNESSHQEEQPTKKIKKTTKTNSKQNGTVSDSDDAPESLTFTAARSAALQSMQDAASSIKAGKEARKQKENKTAKKKNLPQSNLKRLPDEVLENLSDVPARPRKRQKLSIAEERIVPSKSMFVYEVPALAGMRVDSAFVPLSSSGGTTQFSIVNLQKAKKQQRKAALIGSLRERMLSRNPRQPVNALLMHRRKQSASGKNKFSQSPA